MTPNKWDMRFLGLAALIGTWSKDPSTQVGAVIVNDDRVVIGIGYNGFPRGVADTPERLNDRETKYSLIVHAEINAILNASGSVRGCTLYTSPFMPCVRCAGQIIQAGITRVVSIANDNPRWVDSFTQTRKLFEEASLILDIVG